MWKEIPNFNNRYLISNYGKILDTKTNNFIEPHMSGVKRRNYPQVTLYKQTDGKTTKHTKRVHSWMAITFFGHVYGDRSVVIDHKDNDPLNYQLWNLQIISIQENNTKDKNQTR